MGTWETSPHLRESEMVLLVESGCWAMKVRNTAQGICNPFQLLESGM